MSIPNSTSGVPVTPLDAALRYARAGWHVFPVHAPQAGKCSCGRQCSSPAKHPLTQRGLLDAVRDEDQIRSWWASWPFANVGIATEPSGLVVIDIDPRHDGEASFAALTERYGKLETLQAITGSGGQHYFFKAPATLKITSRSNAFGADFPGIDVRAMGGYVVAAPSLHISGHEYAWELSSLRPPIPTPTWVADMLCRQERTPMSGVDDDSLIVEGDRNHALARFAGRLRRVGSNVETITDSLLVFNAKQVRPPLSESEVRAIAKSIGRYDPVDVPSDISHITPAELDMLISVDIADVPNVISVDKRRYTVGISTIDTRMKPIRPGEFIVLGARQGCGKTAFAEQIAIANASKYRVLFATLEMRMQDVRDRMIGRMLRCDQETLLSLQKIGSPEYNNAKDALDGLQISFYAPRLKKQKTSAAVMAAAEKHNADILIVDYTRYLTDWKAGDTQTCGAVVEAFSQWCKDKRTTVVLVSQLGRDAQGKRPIESQLQDCGRLEQEAEKIILIHRPFKGTDDDTLAEIIVAKNRSGPEFRAHAHWSGQSTLYSAMTSQEEAFVSCCQQKARAQS